LAEANRAIPAVRSNLRVSHREIEEAVAALPQRQRLNFQTRSVHAAAFSEPGHALVLREDVGRHNALDKLAGALLHSGRSAGQGIVVVSSRISIEMVQKAGMMGAAVVVGISAPTALAVRTAEAVGITLVGIARDDGFEVFTHPERITSLGTVPRQNLAGIWVHASGRVRAAS
jgi:FdhD protein